MLQLIGLFFPAFLSLAVYEGLDADRNMQKHDLWNHLKYYGAFTVLDVATACLIEKILKPSIDFALNGNFTDHFLSVSYLVFVVIAAIFWGYTLRILGGVLQIQIQNREDIVDNMNAHEEEKN